MPVQTSRLNHQVLEAVKPRIQTPSVVNRVNKCNDVYHQLQRKLKRDDETIELIFQCIRGTVQAKFWKDVTSRDAGEFQHGVATRDVLFEGAAYFMRHDIANAKLQVPIYYG